MGHHRKWQEFTHGWVERLKTCGLDESQCRGFVLGAATVASETPDRAEDVVERAVRRRLQQSGSG